MKDIITNVQVFIKTHRRIILPLIPLCLLFFGLVFFNFGSPTTTTQQTTIQPTQIDPQEQSTIIEEASTPEDWYEDEGENYDITGFEQKETLADGTLQYTYASEGALRPQIIITTPTNKLIIQRTPATAEFTLPQASYFKELYGNPIQIVTGSKVYGSQAQIVIYKNAADIINPQTNEVFEHQFFPGLSIEEYLQKYAPQN